jgi:uncharacterized protein (DUF433 family)
MVTVHSIDTIISDPAVRDGHPIVAGTSIRVTDLAASHIYRGLTAEDLAVNFALDLGQVHAALAYYYQHKTALDALMRREVEQSERLLAQLDSMGKLIRFE